MTITDEIKSLVHVGILMAQELQEFVGDAVDASDDPDALKATQALIEDWERAYSIAGVEARWQDMITQNDDDGGFCI